MDDIRITKNERGFAVYQGERFVEGLCWDEAIGQIINLTHPDLKKECYPMLTDEEYLIKLRTFRARPKEHGHG